MKTVGTRILIFAAAFMVYAKINDESNLMTVGLIFGLLGLGLMIFGPKK